MEGDGLLDSSAVGMMQTNGEKRDDPDSGICEKSHPQQRLSPATLSRNDVCVCLCADSPLLPEGIERKRRKEEETAGQL